MFEASSILGISQVDLENKYYMVDIPEAIKEKYRERNIEHFVQFQMMLASNNRVMDEDNYKKFIENLTKNLRDDRSETGQGEELDRHAFETLRLLTQQGANRTGRG